MKSDSSFHRARAIVRAATRTLRKNPRLLCFPLIGAVVRIGVIVCLVMLGLRVSMGWQHTDGSLSPLSAIHFTTATGFAAAIGLQLIAVATAVALTHAALEALAGRTWTIGQAFARAARRRRVIAGYAVLKTLAHVSLGAGRRGSNRRGRGRRRGRRRHRRHTGPFKKLGRLAWSAATYLVVPVLAREDLGPFDAIGRSSKLLRTTWREGILGRWTLGWLWFPYTLLCVVPLAVTAALGVQDERVWLLIALLCLCSLGCGGVVIGTIDAIYRAALYVYACEGVIPRAFDVDELHAVWHAAAPEGVDAEDDEDEDDEDDEERADPEPGAGE